MRRTFTYIIHRKKKSNNNNYSVEWLFALPCVYIVMLSNDCFVCCCCLCMIFLLVAACLVLAFFVLPLLLSV